MVGKILSGLIVTAVLRTLHELSPLIGHGCGPAQAIDPDLVVEAGYAIPEIGRNDAFVSSVVVDAAITGAMAYKFPEARDSFRKALTRRFRHFQHMKRAESYDNDIGRAVAIDVTTTGFEIGSPVKAVTPRAPLSVVPFRS